MTRVPPAAPRPRALENALLALAVAGLAIAGYLVLIHAGVGGQICDLSETVSCDKVAASPWSSLLGVPLAAWGALAYIAVAAIALVARRGAVPHPGAGGGLLVLLTGAMSAVALVLAYVSEVIIGALCLFCAASWLVSFALLFLSWRLARRAGGVGAAIAADLRAVARRPAPAAGLAAVLVVLAVGLLAFYRRAPAPPPPAPVASASRPAPVSLPSGLVVLEFSDYECPHCARMHAENKAVLARNPTLRLERRHFPLDEACNPLIKRPFHVGSCDAARAALCADAQGKFEAMDDALFANQQAKAPLEAVAAQAGLDQARFRACLDAPETAARLAADIQQGIALNVRGTPTYAVDGRTFQGGLPALLAEVAARSGGAAKN